MQNSYPVQNQDEFRATCGGVDVAEAEATTAIQAAIRYLTDGYALGYVVSHDGTMLAAGSDEYDRVLS